ncbi:MAG: NAD(P)-dependent oxidoreductase [Alsobacter sp.]
MTRVLVTGGSGFLGRPTVAALLAQGHEVHVAGRGPSPGKDVAHHPFDLLGGDGAGLLAALRPDVILHLAWFVEHGRFWEAPENLDWVAATLRLARASDAAGVARFVGIGTCMEYDWSVEPGRPRREADALTATQLYGEAKIATYRLLARFFAADGPGFAWARVFHPYGPGEPQAKLVTSLLRTAREGGDLEIRSGPLVRDFIAAEDVGTALAALATSRVTGAVNIASGAPSSVRRLVETVQALPGCRGRFLFRDAPAGSEPPAMTADVTRLREEVGVPPPPPLARRLQEMAEALA